jgi:hypothetical protein
MKGTLLANKNVTATTTKGSDDITSLVITNPADLNAGLQASLVLAVLNAEDQPVVTGVSETNVSTDRTYTFQVSDGKTTVTDSATLRFYFPYLHGATVSNGAFDRFTTLTKSVAPKQNQTFDFDAIDRYFWIGFPASYVTGTYVIKDQNGFDVTEEFTATLEDITSSGLDINWTEEYVILRTTNLTDISGRYSIEFRD